MESQGGEINVHGRYAFKKEVVENMVGLELWNHIASAAPFHGSNYTPDLDEKRLKRQIHKVFNCMKDGIWRTLSEIEEIIRAPQASISANLRNLRKACYGSHTVDRRRRGDPTAGLFEYRLVVPVDTSFPELKTTQSLMERELRKIASPERT